MNFVYRISLLLVITASFLISEETFNLKDGSVIQGTTVSETESDIQLQTKFGLMTISKSDLVLKKYKVVLNSGETLVGEKILDTEILLKLRTSFGVIDINKTEVQNIQEVQASTPQSGQPLTLGNTLLGAGKIDKDTEFSLGEEQLIDLFFDPTAYTLDRGTFYFSGLSFGFGLTDNLQITAKWSQYLFGDFNIRAKYKLFEIGNWEKQSALSVGTHFHTVWEPNSKYEWHSGSIVVPTYDGEWVDSCEGSGVYENCWHQKGPDGSDTRYWGGYYNPHHVPVWELEENLPDGYDASATDKYYINDKPDTDIDYAEDYDPYDNDNEDSELMMEVFIAYTTSNAREGLRGRISHTIGGNFQYSPAETEVTQVFYRGYYGIDVDINKKLKMIGEVFYDPYYLEFHKRWENDNYWGENADEWGDDQPVEKDEILGSLHYDFGFIYAFSETFRFGIHFQQPFVAFYWKF